MKRLTLVRHANAEWKDASIPDFERALNKKGLSEAEAIGRLLLENDLVPDLLLASTSRRTQQTAEIIGRVLSLPARCLKSAEPLYLARAEVILSIAQATGPKVEHLAIVGHNPGISELARIVGPPDATIAELSTACACTLTFITPSWAEVTAPASHAVQYEPPARLFNLFT
jgi:phosphohistidine phosphatase